MKTVLCRKWARAVRSLRTRQGSLLIFSATAPNKIGAGAAMGRDERGLAAMELLRVFAEIHRRPESACGGAGREPAAQRRLHHPLCPQLGATMPAQTGGGVERERENRVLHPPGMIKPSSGSVFSSPPPHSNLNCAESAF
ncbi:uncharacterized [Tachysurus ichikawai]